MRQQLTQKKNFQNLAGQNFFRIGIAAGFLQNSNRISSELSLFSLEKLKKSVGFCLDRKTEEISNSKSCYYWQQFAATTAAAACNSWLQH